MGLERKPLCCLYSVMYQILKSSNSCPGTTLYSKQKHNRFQKKSWALCVRIHEKLGTWESRLPICTQPQSSEGSVYWACYSLCFHPALFLPLEPPKWSKHLLCMALFGTEGSCHAFNLLSSSGQLYRTQNNVFQRNECPCAACFYCNIWNQFDVLLILFCQKTCDRHQQRLLGDPGQDCYTENVQCIVSLQWDLTLPAPNLPASKSTALSRKCICKHRMSERA